MTQQEYIVAVNNAKIFNDLYFNKHISLISDADFDKLVADIEQTEQEHPEWILSDSPTRHAGTDATQGFQKVAHRTPMLSLNKAYTMDAVANWCNKFWDKYPKEDIVIEWKLDGLSCSLVYEYGKLVRAVTRGDGNVGDDVTAQAIACNVPQDIFYLRKEPYCEFRGEIIMSHEAFRKYNETAVKKAANPRNLASGTLKSYDANLCKERGLEFVVWDCVNLGLGVKYMLSTLDRCGFTNTSATTFSFGIASKENNCDHIRFILRHLEERRNSYPYPVDGLVIKPALRKIYDEMGYTEHHPKASIAYKFPASEDNGTVQNTKLKDIEFSMANTGKVTPVAIFEPISLYGTTVQRVSIGSHRLYQQGYPWRVGDTLTITKGGEIIPKILKHEHDGNGLVIEHPETCPHCGSILMVEGAHIFCRNPRCQYKLNKPESERKRMTNAATEVIFDDTPTSKCLEGLGIVVSGVFENRRKLETLVINHGGKLQHSVNGNTSFIVAGPSPAAWENNVPGKAMKAKQMNVPIISEQEFMNKIK